MGGFEPAITGAKSQCPTIERHPINGPRPWNRTKIVAASTRCIDLLCQTRVFNCMKDYEVGCKLINEGKYSEFFEKFEPDDVAILNELFPEDKNIELLKLFNFHRIKTFNPMGKRKNGDKFKIGDCIAYIYIEYRNPLDTIDNVDIEIIAIHQDDIEYILQNYKLIEHMGILKFRKLD